MYTYEVEYILEAYLITVKICQQVYFYQHLGFQQAIDVLPK